MVAYFTEVTAKMTHTVKKVRASHFVHQMLVLRISIVTAILLRKHYHLLYSHTLTPHVQAYEM